MYLTLEERIEFLIKDLEARVKPAVFEARKKVCEESSAQTLYRMAMSPESFRCRSAYRILWDLESFTYEMPWAHKKVFKEAEKDERINWVWKEKNKTLEEVMEQFRNTLH
jgi:hypothetical protein